ncbi:hypothetical protein XACLC80_410038 [Xanthomonas citri pv. citri]|nr:hypothetical protein XACLC80_410038 [Xanthomonas citri pv. citri]
MLHAGIAQLVERNLAKVEVASSSLVSRSKFKVPFNASSKKDLRVLGIPTFLKHQRHLLTHCFGQCT